MFFRISILLTISILILSGIYFIFFNDTKQLVLELLYSNALQLQATNTHIYHFKGTKRTLTASAKTVFMRENSNQILFVDIKGIATSSNATSHFQSHRASLVTGKYFHLYNKVRLILPNKLHLTTYSLFFNLHTNSIYSLVPVRFYSMQMKGTAKTLFYSQNKQTLTLKSPKIQYYVQ